VHVVADLPADPQTAEVVQEREGTLNDPSLSAQAGAVFGVAACDQWPDAEFAYQSPVLVVVVSAVREDHVGASAGPAALAPHRRHGFQQRDELGDVVAVATGERDSERDPGPVGDQVVLAASPAPVNRTSPSLGPPFSALTCEESTTAREKSSASAACSFASRTSCSRCHTPASCH
jgi:hypothetical protein